MGPQVQPKCFRHLKHMRNNWKLRKRGYLIRFGHTEALLLKKNMTLNGHFSRPAETDPYDIIIIPMSGDIALIELPSPAPINDYISPGTWWSINLYGISWRSIHLTGPPHLNDRKTKQLAANQSLLYQEHIWTNIFGFQQVVFFIVMKKKNTQHENIWVSNKHIFK